MRNVFLSGAHGSGCSLIKSLAVQSYATDQQVGTCHESWNYNSTPSGDRIVFDHWYSRGAINQRWQPDFTIWLKINPENVLYLCHRIVILDFLYTQDPTWIQRDWCWTEAKHNRIAGPDWPKYSRSILDYPQWCLDEMCQVAYERSLPWMSDNNRFDLTVDSNELFGTADPISLSNCLSELGSKINHDFLLQWQQKNQEIYHQYRHLFSWTPNWNRPTGWPYVTIHDKDYE